MDDALQDRQLTGESCRAAAGLTLPAEAHHAFQGSPRDSHTGGLRCLHLPLSSAEPGGLLALAARWVPDAQVPTKTPAGRRSSCPVTAPGGQSDPTPHGERTSLPIRSPGAHLHPLLRRPRVAGRVGSAGSGA